MVHPAGKNKTFRKILELSYERYMSAKAAGQEDFKARYLEFYPSEVIDQNRKSLQDCYPDPCGIFVGCAFELASRGYLIPSVVSRYGMSGFAFSITEAGRQLWENKVQLEGEFPTAKGNFAFVIMSFGDGSQLEDAYKGIKRVVEGCGYKCIRVDEIEHNRRITDKVIECILHAKFIVADLTGERQNCYYEVGFAHAKGKEVIPIIRYGEHMHFDLKDYNFIIYENATELERRLRERVLGTVGEASAEGNEGAED